MTPTSSQPEAAVFRWSWVRLPVLFMGVGLAVLAWWLSTGIRETEIEMRTAVRSTIVRIADQARQDVRELVLALLAADQSPDTAFKADLAFRQASERVEAFRSLVSRHPPRAAPAIMTLAVMAERDLLYLEPHVERAGQGLPATFEAQVLSEDLQAVLNQITSELVFKEADADQALQRQLIFKRHALTVALAGVLFCGIVVIVLLWRQNLALSRARIRRVEEAKAIEFHATHDHLTRLVNRGYLVSELEQANPGASLILSIDLDGFKAVNDTLGHLAGDQLLVSVAKRLMDVVGADPRNLASRFGGDEFVVLLYGLSSDEGLSLAATILSKLRVPHDLDGYTVCIDGSIGISIVDIGNPLESLREADVALQRAKASGKGSVCLFDPAMDEQLAVRRRLEGELARSLGTEQFSVVYQPIVTLPSQTMVGVEALLRWTHPELGPISPVDFVPIAEATGAIVDLGRFVLKQACADATALPDDLSVSVNLSGVQFMRGDLVETVRQALATSGLSPHRLRLEITETVMMRDEPRTRAIVTQLKTLGVQISLDDFGTGYSALSHLRSLGVDEIKIDRSFVTGLGTDQNSCAIIQAIVALGRALGLQVTAEGIETHDDAVMLLGAGCMLGQGYLFSRPLPLADLLRHPVPQAKAA